MRTSPHFAARLEDRWLGILTRVLRRIGWQETIVAFTGIGTPEHVRVLARVVLRPPRQLGLVQAAQELIQRRGWRNFVAAPTPHARVSVVVDDQRVDVEADRGGYIDVRITNPGLTPGWHSVRIEGARGGSAMAPVQVVDSEETFGIVSDIDDTILSTWLPRLFVAAWNSFVLTEQARQAVPGMARLFQQLLAENPGAPIVFVSTGAWNTYPMVSRFLERHGIPRGALLLTDWGPTNTGWFRSGADHKRTCLRELARDLPNIAWVLVGDDGQHDPDLYAEFATLQPEHVRARAIRQLSPGEHALSHGGLAETPSGHRWQPDTAPEVRAPDGDGLADKLRGII
ncbi:MAG: App1 family protein [Arachnia sp.]